MLRGGSGLVAVRASRCGGFPCGAQALGRGGSVVVAPRLEGTGSIVVVHGLKLLQGIWDLPRSGMEIVSPALAGEFFTTEPPGKSQLRC